MFGICDGHGIFGHHVSALIKRSLPNQFEKQLFVHKKEIPGALKEAHLIVNTQISN